MVDRIINGVKTGTKGFEHLYPFEGRFADINGHRMHYLDEGTGKPVIMVHGNPTWSFYFRNPVRRLSAQFRCIVPDHIGCGFSDKPGAKEYDYTLERRVADLDELIRQLDITEKITLVVHDWGGMIGLAWAVDHPDRIDRLIITNTAGFLLPEGKSFPFRLWLIKYLFPFAVPAVRGLNLFSRGALYMASVTPLPKAVKKGLTAPYNSWKNRIATLKFVQDIPIQPSDKSYQRVHHVDTHLSVLAGIPMMFLWGTMDFVFDQSFLDEFSRRFPRMETHVFEDAGHYLFEDKPEETSELIYRFLTK